jgi:flagellar operon protein (TIGR03826 family)
MKLDFRYCSRCGRLFARTISSTCPSCLKEIEEEYQRCYHYLREHKGCTLQELSEETGVSIRQITKFIHEGRISLSDAPNLGYPCDSCGKLIREHRLCAECRDKLSKEMKYTAESIKARQERLEAERRAQSYRYKGTTKEQTSRKS